MIRRPPRSTPFPTRRSSDLTIAQTRNAYPPSQNAHLPVSSDHLAPIAPERILHPHTATHSPPGHLLLSHPQNLPADFLASKAFPPAHGLLNQPSFLNLIFRLTTAATRNNRATI